MRKLLLGLLLLLLVAPASSNSVGLGEVRLESYLNQPLRAEVPVRGAAAAGDSLQIRHAGEDAYRSAGLNRGGVPGDLNIELVGEGADQRVLLTTRQPVREPYVGVLLEARWDGGRTLREITLLLDPPGTLPNETGAPVTTPTERAPDVDAPDADETYQVRSGDTLYRIVERSGISGVSMNQAMLAFLRANPQAFADDNVNSLLAGVELRVPSPTELDAVSAGEASAEVRAQTEAWSERSPAAAAPEAPAEPAAEADSASPEEPAGAADEVAAENEEGAAEDEPAADEGAADDEAVAMEEEAAAEEEVASADAEDGAVAEDRLEIVTELLPETEEGAAADPASPDLLQEALLSQRAEMEGMRDQLAELREELGERGRLAEISSEGMAELEDQLQALRAERNELMARLDRAEAAREAPLHERVMNDPLLLMMAVALLVLLLLVLLVFARGGRREVLVDERVTGMGPRADNRNVKPDTSGQADYRAEEISADRAGAGVAAAAGAGMVVGESEDKREDDEPGSPVAQAPAAEPEESVGEARVAETSGGSLSAQDDVLAEVDVCLAYGMNDQAVESLTEALQNEPDNAQYRLKLVESYLALGDTGRARQAATDLHARLRPDDEATRDRLAELESQMGDMPAADAGGTPAEPVTEDTSAFAEEPATEEPATEAEPAGGDEEEDFGELDFSGFDVPEPEDDAGKDMTGESEERTAADSRDSGLSFDLDESLEEDLVSAAASAETAPEGETDDLGGLSFDIDENDLPALDETKAGESPASDAPADLDLPPVEDEAGGLQQPVGAADAAGAGEAEPEPGQSGGDGTAEADENETRLSLAQAYADMGDEEGAKELLDEIAASGSDEQKRQAEAIREQLQS
ncbi:MAG: FimV/HubP family polar landmark protein [Pseudomonadota bacterium]